MLKLIGDKVIVQLDKAPRYSTTPDGVVEALFEEYETEGGRPSSRTSSKDFLAQGTVLQISSLASTKLEELSSPLKVGDRVLVSHHATSPNYYFFPTRDRLVQPFTGIVALPHILIDAIIIEDGKEN